MCIYGILRVKYEVYPANTTTVFAVQNYLYGLLSSLIAYFVDHEQPIVMGLVFTVVLHI